MLIRLACLFVVRVLGWLALVAASDAARTTLIPAAARAQAGNAGLAQGGRAGQALVDQATMASPIGPPGPA